MIDNKDIKTDLECLILKNNGQISDRIDYNQILDYKIVKGSYSKNWIVSLTLGITIIIFSGIVLQKIFSNLDTFNLNVLEIIAPKDVLAMLISVLLLFVFGVWLIIVAVKRDFKLIINTKDKLYKVFITNTYKQGQIDDLKSFFENKLKNRA